MRIQCFECCIQRVSIHEQGASYESERFFFAKKKMNNKTNGEKVR